MSKIAFMLALALPGIAAAQTLPANVEVPVVLVQEVSSQRMKAGATFDVAVARDVWVDGRVAIPRGTPGRGEVTWRTGRGAFGKSGKMEIEVRSLDMGGVAVPLTGKFREEGQGNIGATIGTIVVAGLVGGAFVTGRSAVFERGRELRAVTTQPVALGTAPFAAPPVLAAVVPAAAPVVVASVAAPPAAVAPVVAALVAPVAVAPAIAAPVAVAPPAIARVVAAPVVVAASAPVVVAASAPVFVALSAPAPALVAATPSAANLRAEAEDARYRQLLAAQQGVRGRSGQGWTISD